MPSYYCPHSSVNAYEITIDPEVLAQLRRSRNALRDYVQSIADAIEQTASGRLTTISGASRLRRLVSKTVMGYPGIQLGALARPFTSLQSRLNRVLRDFDEVFNRDYSVSLAEFDALAETFIRGITAAETVLRNLIMSVNNASQQIDEALNNIEETIRAVSQGRQGYTDSIIDGAADGILVQFYDGSVYQWEAARVGDATIDTMISLAEAQAGLGTFIYANVRFDYS